MKQAMKLKPISILAICFCAVNLFAQTPKPVSNLPVITTAVGGDDLVDNATNSGSGTWTTSRINVSNFVNSPFMVTNRSFASLLVNNTNVITFTSTLSFTNGQYTLQDSGGHFANSHFGDGVAVGGEQFYIIQRLSANQVLAQEYPYGTAITFATTYTNNWQYYFANTYVGDINNQPDVAFDSGAGIALAEESYLPGPENYQQNAAIKFIAHTNSAVMDWNTTADDGPRLEMGGMGVNHVGVFSVSIGAQYDSLAVKSNNLVSIKYGITNEYFPGVTNFSPTTIKGETFLLPNMGVTGAGTIGGILNDRTLTSTSAQFGPTNIGWILTTGINNYTITAYNSATNVSVFPASASTFGGASYNLSAPTLDSHTTTPQPITEIDSSGNILLTQGVGIMFGDFSQTPNVFEIRNGVGSSGTDQFQIVSSQNGNAVPFAISIAAPASSLDINVDGSINLSLITNSAGLPIVITNTPVVFGGPISVSTITNSSAQNIVITNSAVVFSANSPATFNANVTNSAQEWSAAGTSTQYYQAVLMVTNVPSGAITSGSAETAFATNSTRFLPAGCFSNGYGDEHFEIGASTSSGASSALIKIYVGGSGVAAFTSSAIGLASTVARMNIDIVPLGANQMTIQYANIDATGSGIQNQVAIVNVSNATNNAVGVTFTTSGGTVTNNFFNVTIR